MIKHGYPCYRDLHTMGIHGIEISIPRKKHLKIFFLIQIYVFVSYSFLPQSIFPGPKLGSWISMVNHGYPVNNGNPWFSMDIHVYPPVVKFGRRVSKKCWITHMLDTLGVARIKADRLRAVQKKKWLPRAIPGSVPGIGKKKNQRPVGLMLLAHESHLCPLNQKSFKSIYVRNM